MRNSPRPHRLLVLLLLAPTLLLAAPAVAAQPPPMPAPAAGTLGGVPYDPDKDHVRGRWQFEFWTQQQTDNGVPQRDAERIALAHIKYWCANEKPECPGETGWEWSGFDLSRVDVNDMHANFGYNPECETWGVEFTPWWGMWEPPANQPNCSATAEDRDRFNAEVVSLSNVPCIPSLIVTCIPKAVDTAQGVREALNVKKTTLEIFKELALSVALGVKSTLAEVFKALTGQVFLTYQLRPELTYENSIVRGTWKFMVAIAMSALTLVTIAGGYELMIKQHTGSPYDGVLELIPRLILGVAGIALSLTLGEMLIKFVNALNMAFAANTFPGWDSANSEDKTLSTAIMALILLAMGCVIVLQWMMRTVIIDVLLILSPLAMLCAILPYTQIWARRWAHVYVGTVMTCFVQFLIINVGSQVITTGVLEGGQEPAAQTLQALILGPALLILALKAGIFLENNVSGGGAVVRVIMNQVTSRGRSGGNGGGRGGGTV